MNDLFENKLDRQIFESTNALWNELRLNDPWSVGYVSTLISDKNFTNKEEWEKFYYRSGEKRNRSLSEIHTDISNILNNELLTTNDRNKIQNLDFQFKKLNYYFGRTTEQLNHKAKILHDEALQRKIEISLSECTEAVRFRVICQTWNGIIIREQNTISYISNKIQNLTYKNIKGSEDHRFAVDYEVYKDNLLLCGLQIKPESYNSDKVYVLRAKHANEMKNNNYTKVKNVPVITVISKYDGTIINKEVMVKLKSLSNQ